MNRLRHMRRNPAQISHIRTEATAQTRAVFLLLAVVVAVSLLLSACGNETSAEQYRTSAEVEIYAAAARQLFDDNFGPSWQFNEVLVVDHPYPVDSQRQDQTTFFSQDQRSAITAAIEHLGPVRFINDPKVIPDSAVVALGGKL